MSEQDKVVIAITSSPSLEAADRIAQALVGERLSACVSRIPGVTST